METVPGVALVYGAGKEADLKELEPLVALAAQMWIRANPGFLSSCSSSAVSSGAVRVASVPSSIPHPRGSSQVSGPARAPEIQFKLQTVAVMLHGPGSYRLTPPVRSYLHRRLSLQGVQEPP